MRTIFNTITLLGIIALTTQCSPPNNQSSDAQRQQLLQMYGADPKSLDKYFGSEAQVACASRADDYLRQIAKYDFAWDKDAEGLLGVKFDKISTTSAGSGMLTLLSTRAKLSNVFGAFQHTDLYCLYNVSSKEVVRFSLYDPAVDSQRSKAEPANAGSNNTGAVLENTVAPPLSDPTTTAAENKKYYEEAKRNALKAYSDQPPAIRQKLAEYEGANELCRGSSDGPTIDKWCPVRDGISQELKNMGMCYGRPTDHSAAESDWHKCDERDTPQ